MSQMTIVMQAALGASTTLAAVSQAVRAIDPELPIANPRTLDAMVSEATWRPRIAATLLGLFASAALILAALGVYGVMSYSVSQRRREMALRMALGARAATVLGMVVGQSMRLGVTGVVAGLFAAAIAARGVAALVYHTSVLDLPVYSAVAALLLAVSCVAGLYPAYRASRIPLHEILRAE
jgi:putative ABC transport system permease protein